MWNGRGEGALVWVLWLLGVCPNTLVPEIVDHVEPEIFCL